MGSVALQFEPLSTQATPPQPGAPTVGQGNAAAAQAAPPAQDTVTLAGRTAEGQQTRGGHGQFGEAAAFFLGERETFRAGNGSAPTQGAATDVPSLPVALTENPGQAGTGTAPAAAQNAQATSAPPSVIDFGGPNNPAAGAAAPGAANSQTPIQQLAQLDQTLQDIGINPQSISLFNRLAMLLYANDPAALRLLAQAVESAAQTLGSTNASSTPSASSSQTLAAPPNQYQSGQSSQSNDQSPSAPAPATTTGVELDIQQAQIAVQSAPDSAAQGNGGTSAASSSQTSSFSIQLQELQVTFAAIGVQEPAATAQSSAQNGQALSVTA